MCLLGELSPWPLEYCGYILLVCTVSPAETRLLKQENERIFSYSSREDENSVISVYVCVSMFICLKDQRLRLLSCVHIFASGPIASDIVFTSIEFSNLIGIAGIHNCLHVYVGGKLLAQMLFLIAEQRN